MTASRLASASHGFRSALAFPQARKPAKSGPKKRYRGERRNETGNLNRGGAEQREGRDIAEITGVGENTVKSRMRYALDRLKDALCDFEEYARALR